MKRKELVGTVVSDRMTKTVVVQVTRLVRHPLYKRVIRKAKRFKAHDPGLKPQVGDEVRMEETRPLSREKRWRVVEILRHGLRDEDREARRVAELEAVGVIHKKQPGGPAVQPAAQPTD
ncbi:MAG: 30S ribosomal protein S17 [Candidatus Omnitrophica bacterium]|nr:30S ribosomal protein S17 [Candidatus Omnitrophota bacterium]